MAPSPNSPGRRILKFVYALITLVVVAVAVAFTLANRAAVTVDLWPLAYVADFPLYFLPLLGLGAGLIIGSLFAGMATLLWRGRAAARSRALKAAQRRIDSLEAKLRDAEYRLEETAKSVPQTLPALPGNAHKAA